MAITPNYNSKPQVVDLTADDGHNINPKKSEPLLGRFRSSKIQIQKARSTAEPPPQALGVRSKTLLTRDKRCQPCQRRQQRQQHLQQTQIQRASAHSSSHGILSVAMKSVLNGVGISSPKRCGCSSWEASNFPITDLALIPSSANEEGVKSPQQESRADPVKEDCAGHHVPKSIPLGSKANFRADGRPLQTAKTDQRAGSWREQSSIEESVTGLDTPQEAVLMAPASLHVVDVSRPFEGKSTARKPCANGYRVSAEYVELSLANEGQKSKPETISKARREMQPSLYNQKYHMLEDEEGHSSSSKPTKANRTEIKGAIERQSNQMYASKQMVLPKETLESESMQQTDLSLLDAGESLQPPLVWEDPPKRLHSARDISRKRTADGTLKAKNDRLKTATPALHTNSVPDLTDAVDRDLHFVDRAVTVGNTVAPQRSRKSAIVNSPQNRAEGSSSQVEVSIELSPHMRTSCTPEIPRFMAGSRERHFESKEASTAHATQNPNPQEMSSDRQAVSATSSDELNDDLVPAYPSTSQGGGVRPPSLIAETDFNGAINHLPSLGRSKFRTTKSHPEALLSSTSPTYAREPQTSINNPRTKGRIGDRPSQRSSIMRRSSRTCNQSSSILRSSASLDHAHTTGERRIPETTTQSYSVTPKQSAPAVFGPIHVSARPAVRTRAELMKPLSEELFLARLAGRGGITMRPYLNFAQRVLLKESVLIGIREDIPRDFAASGIVHTDFTDLEMEEIDRIICHLYPINNVAEATLQVKGQLMRHLNMLNEGQWQKVLKDCQSSEILRTRDNHSLEHFLKDATAGRLPSRSTFLKIDFDNIYTPQVSRRKPSVSSLLRLREMGSGRVGASNFSARGLHGEVSDRACEEIVPWRSWTGASNDVMVVAWSSDGNLHAAGASAESSAHNMQYNRRNNLLLGDLNTNKLIELPDHRVNRPLPSSIASGPNSQQATYDACDPMLYITLTGIQFSATGERMYTSSYDRTVKVWDVSRSSEAHCIATLFHGDEVEVLALSDHHHNALATGTRVVDKSIRIYDIELENEDVVASRFISLSSTKALKHPSKEMYPSSLRWGISQPVRDYLLAGFSPRPKMEEEESDDPPRDGDLCLWDVRAQQTMKVFPSSQNIFDCVWHPTLPIFATGSTPGFGNIVDRNGTRSVVRVYEPTRTPGSTIEYECPALDMNDVTFCPANTNYITAGCTDGVTYVWDFRKRDRVLHKLKHGDSITPLRPWLTREQADMGVRMAAWGKSGQILYTGSSDGIIKAWNINHSPEDVHLRDVAQIQAGVMCGAFSPDYSNLLIGDSSGAVHILSAAPISTGRDTEEIKLQRSGQVDAEDQPGMRPRHDTEMADAANALLASGEIWRHPVYGAGKGPNYKGPYARYAREEGVDPSLNPLLQPAIQAQQLSSKQSHLARSSTATPAERRNRQLQRDLAKARNRYPYCSVGRRSPQQVERGRDHLRDLVRVAFDLGDESPLHHFSDDCEDTRFSDLPSTSEESEVDDDKTLTDYDLTESADSVSSRIGTNEFGEW